MSIPTILNASMQDDFMRMIEILLSYAFSTNPFLFHRMCKPFRSMQNTHDSNQDFFARECFMLYSSEKNINVIDIDMHLCYNQLHEISWAWRELRYPRQTTSAQRRITMKKNLFHRLLSAWLVVAMLIGCIPFGTVIASAAAPNDYDDICLYESKPYLSVGTDGIFALFPNGAARIRYIHTITREIRA